MISKMAVDDIMQLKAEGLDPTPADVVRLNAVGLNYERMKGTVLDNNPYKLPRYAALSKDIGFRQPTIGHEIWIDMVSKFIDTDDYQSMLALYAFALSRDWQKLPDPYCIADIEVKIREFTETLKDFTTEQIFNAVMYAKDGCDQSVGEFPARKIDDDDSKDDDEYDFDECVAVGVMHEGHALLWGITEAEMKSMTRSRLESIMQQSYYYHQFPIDGRLERELGKYYRTLDQIHQRLLDEQKKSKNDGDDK